MKRWLTEILFIYLIPFGIMMAGYYGGAGSFVTIVVPLILMFSAFLHLRRPWEER